MNIKQSAAISTILLAVVLTGAGCLGRQQPATARPATVPAASVPAAEPSAPVVPTEPTTTPELRHPDLIGSMTTTVTGDTTTVRDERTKVAFSYPTSLGKVDTRVEYGVGMETDIETATTFDCLEQRAFDLNGTPFLVVNDTWQCQTLGRGGYWGDQARAFSTEADVKLWCETKDVCEPYVNKNGVTIYRAYTKSDDFWGEPLLDIDMYAAWNPNINIHGILISNQGFVQAGLGRMQGEVAGVADSLSFLE